MKNESVFTYDQLSDADLIVDATYQGTRKGNAHLDPISKLFRCGYMGGFRYLGSVVSDTLRLCVLSSSMAEVDWPDYLDITTGTFTYFGDNRQPGKEMLQTNKGGNSILHNVFNHLHLNTHEKIPPFFIFTKSGEGRGVVFRGLAVPGAPGITQDEDLVAVWRSVDGRRFQNYKAIFTILNEPTISRTWLNDLIEGESRLDNAPGAWKQWISSRRYEPLIAPQVYQYRNRIQQMPNESGASLITTVIDFFKKHERGEYAFEKCAAEIASMFDKNVIEYELTRPWRDGGRDAIGKYRIGYDKSNIIVDFALEAKCHMTNIGCGVKEVSRLISRLRYRQFGIFVTTSYVSEQAYKEITEDKHPVLVISAVDILNILKNHGYDTKLKISEWLKTNF